MAEHVPGYKKRFFNEVNRCEDLERYIRFFESELIEAGERGLKFELVIDHEPRIVKTDDDDREVKSLEEMETLLDKKETELNLLNGNLSKLYNQKSISEEYIHVIEKASGEIKESEGPLSDESSSESEKGPTSGMISRSGVPQQQQQQQQGFGNIDQERQGGLGYLCGVIDRDKFDTFQLLVYRTTRGNSVMKNIEIPQKLYSSVQKKEVEKNVFVIFFSAQKVKEKVKKISDTLGANVYPIPRGTTEIQKALQEERDKIVQLNETIVSSESRYKDVMSEISMKLDHWKKVIALEKATYDTMNKFDYRIGTSVIAEGWVPRKRLGEVQNEMKIAERGAHSQVDSLISQVETDEMPPTYYETNKFTEVFQSITNAYAIPTYKEINPTPITIITFPFFFAVMFGDFGHGSLLFLSAAFLCAFENVIREKMEANDLLSMLFGGRYMLLLMGTFSLYTGALYNDCFGISMDMWGSRWIFTGLTGTFTGLTYEFGVDPGWFETVNKLSYYNSLKMKMAIVFGVTHMLVGVCLKMTNFYYFRKYAYLFMEGLPELIILGLTFGYLAFMIVYKWCVNWIGLNLPAPALLTTMTDFFLHPTTANQPPLYPGQIYVQMTFLIMAICAIPVLLIPTPVYKWVEYMMKKRHEPNIGGLVMESEQLHSEHAELIGRKEEDAQLSKVEGDSKPHQEIEGISETHMDLTESRKNANISSSSKHQQDQKHHEGFEYQEVMTHQLIHTIEYVLGSISNTASYLRLWALSLAHAELSEVFFQLTIQLALTMNGILGTFNGSVQLNAFFDYSGILLVILFTIWLILTLGVLLGLESLSAFLHSLRLHWVEFNSMSLLV